MIATKENLIPDCPLAVGASQNQRVVGRVLTRHVGLKPDLRPNGQSGLVLFINPDSSIEQKCVIPAQAGIQTIKQSPVAAQHRCFVGFAGFFSCWIPACAGMTG
jgi:hypothetical protein